MTHNPGVSVHDKIQIEQWREKRMAQDASGEYTEPPMIDYQAIEDDDQAAYLRNWDQQQTVKRLRKIATRQPRRRTTGREIATWLALACITVLVLRAPWWLPPLIDALGWAGH